MRWWKWAAGAIGIAALGAFAALWVLTEADVLRWGAASAMHDRIEALENQAPPAAPSLVAILDRLAALEEQTAQLDLERGAALGSALDRIAALEDRIASVERQAAQTGQSEAQFIVANTVQRGPGPPIEMSVEYCIIYAVSGSVQERCYWGQYEQTGPNTWSLTPRDQWVADCFYAVRIGDALPDCWR